MEKEVVIQIFSGGFAGESATFEDVKQKLDPILSRIRVSKVIMGWSVDSELYEKTRDYLMMKNVEFYLWLPVFSEIGMLEETAPLIDYLGKEVVNYQWHEQENFTFYCPNHPLNTFSFIRVFEKYFSSIGFTGVFLDKIRYPSFVNHLGGVLTCFCPYCHIKYKSAGFHPEKLELLIEALPQQPTPLGIVSYKNGKYTFDNEYWKHFFQLKSQFITDAVRGICQYFSERHYKIGLDVMAPFVSPFVGQDIESLASFTDFIKPMMYRMTKAPAGLPFEMESILQETTSGESQKESFYRMLGFDPRKNPFDIDFTIRELSGITAAIHTPVYPGLEINRIEEVAEVHPPYIKETVQAYGQTPVKGFVLSWNLLNAPQENIDQIVKLFT